MLNPFQEVILETSPVRGAFCDAWMNQCDMMILICHVNMFWASKEHRVTEDFFYT